MSNNRTSLSVSVRRHFVDGFFNSHSPEFGGKEIIDIGGKKENKRGFFDIGKHASKVTYVNIDESTRPDIIADAANIPLPDACCDAIFLGETLEHLPDPKSVLKEAYRLLRSGAKIYATVPFLYPVHADPYDFGRYTDYFWQKASTEIGFDDIVIERHGGMFAVGALMAQHFFRSKRISWRPIQLPLVTILMWLDRRTTAPLLLSWTTGYGLIFTKK